MESMPVHIHSMHQPEAPQRTKSVTKFFFMVLLVSARLSARDRLVDAARTQACRCGSDCKTDAWAYRRSFPFVRSENRVLWHGCSAKIVFCKRSFPKKVRILSAGLLNLCIWNAVIYCK